MVGDRSDDEGASTSLRPGPSGVRRLRIAAVSSLVVLVVAGGIGVLWLSTRASQPRPATSTAQRPSAEPPVRLDTLPLPRPSGSARSTPDPRKAERSKDRGGRSGGASAAGEADSSDDDTASEAEIRRAIAALARENARIAALLSGDLGRSSGTGEIVRPVSGPTIARFGRPWGRLHAGIDIEVPSGTPVHAADAGRVVVSGVEGGYGKLVCVQHTGTLSTCYAHNSRLDVDEGESVDSGDVIAQSGCSGRCYGDHLHFEVRVRGKAVNPKDYL